MAAPAPLPRPVLRPVTGPGHPLLVGIVEDAGPRWQHLKAVVAHATFDPELPPAFKFRVDAPDPDFYCCCYTQQDKAFAMLERIAELEREQQVHTTRIQADTDRLTQEVQPEAPEQLPDAHAQAQEALQAQLEQLTHALALRVQALQQQTEQQQEQLDQAKAQALRDTQVLQARLEQLRQQEAAQSVLRGELQEARCVALAAQGDSRALRAQVQVLRRELEGAQAQSSTQQAQARQAAAQRDILDYLYRHQAGLQPISGHLAQLRCNMARQRAADAPQEQPAAAAAHVMVSTWRQVQQGSGVPAPAAGAAAAAPRAAAPGHGPGKQAQAAAALAALVPGLVVQLLQARQEVGRLQQELQEARRPVDDDWLADIPFINADEVAAAIAAAPAAAAAAAAAASPTQQSSSETNILMEFVASGSPSISGILDLIDDGDQQWQGTTDATMGE